jgi:hypothetical protein
MTWSDPIVDEVRRARDAYAARFNYDLRAIVRDLREQEKRSGRKVASDTQDATVDLTPSRLPIGAAVSPSTR